MADCKRKTANLFDESTLLNGYYDTTSSYQYVPTDNYRCFSLLLPAGTYTIFAKSEVLTIRLLRVSSASLDANLVNLDNRSYTFTLPVSETIYVSLRNSTTTNDFTGLTIMLNTGSIALPYEPYGWVHSLRKLTTATDTFTTLPVDIYADGNNATVGISGNTVQSGTLTPDNPIMPQGTGERTGNLWNEDYTGISGNLKYVPIFVGDGTFTLSIDTPDYSRNASLFLLSGNVTSGASTPINGVYNGISRTTDSLNGYITIAFRRQSESFDPTTHKTMLNLGSTPLPYEPYGYKIPISSANTTTPVYLGEVETTRKIKKIVFTGSDSEGWANQTLQRKLVSFPKPSGVPAGTSRIISSHFVTVQTINPAIGELYAGGSWINFNYDNVNNLDTWKSYLAQQYAAGTPVIVWYVLAEPETGIVNEPLMKIGDYADTVSGITVPTIANKDTFDVDTTLKPSDVSLSYTGWHDATVKEWDGSQWNE